METLTGTVKKIIYSSDERENKYYVLLLETETSDGTVIAVGNIGSVYEDCNLVVKGKWVRHREYGRQFKVEQYDEVMPTTLKGFKNFLEHGPFQGIGPVCSHNIVEHFGFDTIHVIENEPERLREVPLIAEQRTEEIIESWKKYKELKEILRFTNQCNLLFEDIKYVYYKHRENTIEEIKKNPYQLIGDDCGIEFHKADEIAFKLGICDESLERCCAGVLHVLASYARDEGHYYLLYDFLLNETIILFDIDESFVENAIDELIDKKRIVEGEIDGKTIFSKTNEYHYEIEIAQRLAEIYGDDGRQYSLDVDKFISGFEIEHKIRFDRYQVKAIKKTIQSKISIMTGSPGTGKTTVTECITAYFNQSGADILLAAPTGKAARRLGNATGMKAVTIHKLLEAINNYEFKRDELNKLSGDLLIVDEMPIVNCFLMYHLLKLRS